MNSIYMGVNRCSLCRLPEITFAFELQTTCFGIVLLARILSPQFLCRCGDAPPFEDYVYMVN
jgi:hypothetical protein